MAESGEGALVDILGLISSGEVTVTAGGHPFLWIRSGEKELDVDIGGAERAGVNLAELVSLEEGTTNVLVASERTADRLSRAHWRLTLYDSGSRVLTMGRGVSRLTARVSVNPLKLKRLLEALR